MANNTLRPMQHIPMHRETIHGDLGCRVVVEHVVASGFSSPFFGLPHNGVSPFLSGVQQQVRDGR